MTTRKGYEHLEAVRDDVNGLPELWDIDRLADYLSVSKRFVYRPLLSPGVRLRATGGGHHQLAFWRDAAGRQRSESFDTAAEADAARQEKLRQRRRGRTAHPTGGRTLLSDWWEKWMGPDRSSVPLAPGDDSIRACRTEPVFGKVRLAGPGQSAP